MFYSVIVIFIICIVFQIKENYVQLFGYDSDDEGILSPLEETPEFVISCKERMAPWVVKLLTPYYIKGHIKGKGIFKALAKHLIRLIYQCSQYPSTYTYSFYFLKYLMLTSGYMYIHH